MPFALFSVFNSISHSVVEHLKRNSISPRAPELFSITLSISISTSISIYLDRRVDICRTAYRVLNSKLERSTFETNQQYI